MSVITIYCTFRDELFLALISIIYHTLPHLIRIAHRNIFLELKEGFWQLDAQDAMKDHLRHQMMREILDKSIPLELDETLICKLDLKNWMPIPFFFKKESIITEIDFM